MDEQEVVHVRRTGKFRTGFGGVIVREFLAGVFLWAGVVGLVSGVQARAGGYWKYQCDMAKTQIEGAKTTANNNKIAAFNKLNEANGAASDAEAAHRYKVVGQGGWTAEKEESYQQALTAGNLNLATGVRHRNAGIWRYDQGTAKVTAGDNYYSQTLYTTALPEYTKPNEPVGALQHFNYSASDYASELGCNNSAVTWYLYAKQLCQ